MYQDFDKVIFETATNLKNFSINLPLEHCLDVLKNNSKYSKLDEVLDSRIEKKELLIKNLIRCVFFIEPVNKDITSTKFTYRWLEDSASFFSFKQNDPRWQEFDECIEIFLDLIKKITSTISDENINLLNKFLSLKVKGAAYELPLDYKDISLDKIHQSENLNWIIEDIEDLIYLRKIIYGSDEEFEITLDNTSFTTSLKEIYQESMKKIKVKTYLTDRAQTGVYQTNREKRWECHSNSVQFATRKDCFEIESHLVKQILKFEGFPINMISQNKDFGLEDEITRCPVTLEKFKYHQFVSEIKDPTHGVSLFQVGHLNPLKSSGGHIKENISWISNDGNRIQGSLSLSKTREMIKKISENMKNLDL